MVELVELANLTWDFNIGTSTLSSKQCSLTQQEYHTAIKNGYHFWKEGHHGQIGILYLWMEYSVQENSSEDEKKH